MTERLALLILLVLLFATVAARRAGSVPPVPVPIGSCEPWMADALPGVGPATRAAMAEAIRAGDLDTLPRSARSVAQRVFAGW